MTWKINELLKAATNAEVELAATIGEMDKLILQKLRRITRHRRYRAKKAAQNLERVRAVADQLRRAA